MGLNLCKGSGGKASEASVTKDLRELLFPLQERRPEAVFTYRARETRMGYRLRGDYQCMTCAGPKTAWRRTLAKEETGVADLRFHDNRHTAATRLLRSSGNLKLVQRLLRHEISPRRPNTRTSRTSIRDLRWRML